MIIAGEQARFEQTGLTMTAEEMAHGIETGSGTRQLGVLLIGVFGAFVLARNRRRNLRIRGSMGMAIFFFFLWALASVAWSDDFFLPCVEPFASRYSGLLPSVSPPITNDERC